MNEAEWLLCGRPLDMLRFLTGRASERKLRLFMIACCRRVWHLLADERSRACVETAERYTDRVASAEDLHRAIQDAGGTFDSTGILGTSSGELLARAALMTVLPPFRLTSFSRLVARGAADRLTAPGADWSAVLQSEEEAQAELIRHIFGNPFRSPEVSGPLGDTMVQLARAVDQGQDCAFALGDALEEAGHPELAGHFRCGTVHPRGCWAVDLLLDKN